MNKIYSAYSVLNIVRVKTEKMTYSIDTFKYRHHSDPEKEIVAHSSVFYNIDAADYQTIEGFVEQIIFNNIGK